MQLSKAKINPKLKKQIFDLLYQVVADIRHPNEAKEFLASFLTKNELDIATRRLGIAYFLNQNRTYSYIKKKLAVSSATVSTVAGQLRKNERGTQIALEKIGAEEWAKKWVKKFSMMMKKSRR